MGEIGNFPPPTTPEEVGARVLMQDRHSSKKNVDDDGMDESEMQIGSDDEMMDRVGRAAMESSGEESEDEMESVKRKIEETKSREGKDNTQVCCSFREQKVLRVVEYFIEIIFDYRLKTWKRNRLVKARMKIVVLECLLYPLTRGNLDQQPPPCLLFHLLLTKLLSRKDMILNKVNTYFHSSIHFNEIIRKNYQPLLILQQLDKLNPNPTTNLYHLLPEPKFLPVKFKNTCVLVYLILDGSNSAINIFKKK